MPLFSKELMFVGLDSRDMRGGANQVAYTEEAKEKSPESTVLRSILNTRQSIGGHHQGLRTCGSPVKAQVCANDMKSKNQVPVRSHANSIGSNFNVVAVNTEGNALRRGKESQKSVPSFQSSKLSGSMLMGGFKGPGEAGELGRIKMFR